MASDDYQYQKKPLPDLPPIGSFSGQGYPPTNAPSIDIANVPQTYDPFNDPAGSGGGGGGGPADLQYITDDADAVFGTGPAGSSTSTTINSGATGDNLLSLTTTDLGTGKAVLNLGANKIWISVDDVETDSNQVDLKALDVCHMGAPGLRQFLCGDAYAPP